MRALGHMHPLWQALMHTLNPLRHSRGKTLRNILLHHRTVRHVGRCMVGWQGVVRTLSNHVVAHAVTILRLRRSKTIIRQVRRAMVWRSLVRRTVMRDRLRNWKTRIVWDERLGLWVERVSIEASRNRMLTLWISRIDGTRQLAKSIRNRTWGSSTGRLWLVRGLVLVHRLLLLLPLLGRKLR